MEAQIEGARRRHVASVWRVYLMQGQRAVEWSEHETRAAGEKALDELTFEPGQYAILWSPFAAPLRRRWYVAPRLRLASVPRRIVRDGSVVELDGDWLDHQQRASA